MQPITWESSQQPELAPPFPDDVEWLNTREPLRLADLHGKFVLLDFWSYG